jgi:hypothetical protein
LSHFFLCGSERQLTWLATLASGLRPRDLFGFMTHRVMLAEKFTGRLLSARAHLDNVKTREVHELGAVERGPVAGPPGVHPAQAASAWNRVWSEACHHETVEVQQPLHAN